MKALPRTSKIIALISTFLLFGCISKLLIHTCIILILDILIACKNSVGPKSPEKSPDLTITDSFAESFLTRFLDTKQIEDFVKLIPAGQEPLQVHTAIPNSILPRTTGTFN